MLDVTLYATEYYPITYEFVPLGECLIVHTWLLAPFYPRLRTLIIYCTIRIFFFILMHISFIVFMIVEYQMKSNITGFNIIWNKYKRVNMRHALRQTLDYPPLPPKLDWRMSAVGQRCYFFNSHQARTGVLSRTITTFFTVLISREA